MDTFETYHQPTKSTYQDLIERLDTFALPGDHQPDTTKVRIVGEMMWALVNPRIAFISSPSSVVQLTIRQWMATSDMPMISR
jgi:hypothetical protein